MNKLTLNGDWELGIGDRYNYYEFKNKKINLFFTKSNNYILYILYISIPRIHIFSSEFKFANGTSILSL